MMSKVFEQAILQGDELLELIPQRAPIVMVDGFYGIIDGCSYSSLHIYPDNLFLADGYLDEAGLLEHIAQSAALRAGYLFRQDGKEIPLGFIASIDKMKIARHAKLGETLQTAIVIEQEIFDITLVAATVYCGEELIASGKMKIYIKQDNG